MKDPDTGNDRSEALEVVVVNDEVARLYKDSPRAAVEHPIFGTLTRYCVALAKYLQNPNERIRCPREGYQLIIISPMSATSPRR